MKISLGMIATRKKRIPIKMNKNTNEEYTAFNRIEKKIIDNIEAAVDKVSSHPYTKTAFFR